MKIGFKWKRGNIEKELRDVWDKADRVESELQGIDCYKLKRVFDKIITKYKDMPIDYSKYPDNWFTEIRPEVLKRAKNKCEFCGVENYSIHPSTGAKVILTIAHLDRDVNNNDYLNLAALCQKDHLNHDRSENIRNRRYGREHKNNQTNLFNN